MSMLHILALVLALFPSVSFAEDPGQAIRDQVQAFAAAFNRGDAAAIASFHAEDAVVMPPGRPTVKGRENIQKFWQGAINNGGRDLSITPFDVQVVGNTGIEVADLKVVIGGKEVVGRHILIRERGPDGKWLIKHDIWNNYTP